ncbi:MAG: hypothetical protein JXA99_06340 [Candidatus Lokiarchaeota archaeon]|nr:hypothetical protein [Candidatus Lokiarchaeota archaeon]
MTNKKKIILVGPPAAGKTTITKVFFQKSNPKILLEKPLEPTRGVHTSLFSLFNSELGIFDLAGQENQNWFSKDNDIFEHSNIITCIFDINSSLENITSFLNNIIDIKAKFDSLSECKIFSFLHKIDTVDNSYLNEKINAIKNYYKRKFPSNGFYMEIFGTSIAKENYYPTFHILSNILISIYPEDNASINLSEYENIKQDLKIIANCKLSVKYKVLNLSNKFNLSFDVLKFHLERLDKLGMIEYLSYKNFIRLTYRSELLKKDLKKEIDDMDKIREDNDIKLFNIFLNLNKIPLSDF